MAEVRFTLDDTQQALVGLAGDILDGEPPDRVWKALGQAGLLALAVPRWLGGAGLGVLETALLLAETGRRALTVPALPTLALGVLPVARWGTRAQQERLLSGLTGDGVVLTAALREPGEPMPAVPATLADPLWTVTGTKVGVPYAAQADRILTPVARGTGGTAIVLVDPTAPGVTLTRTPAASDLPEYRMRLDGVPAEPLGTAVSIVELYRYAVAGACATGDGALAGALALTARHVGTRHQFGRPLSTFQAVAQQVADVAIAARTLHLATLAACWGFHRAPTDLDVAGYWLCAVAPPALRTCHHLHGGLGLDASYPLHRHTDLVKDLVRLVGGTEYRLGRLGEEVVRCSST